MTARTSRYRQAILVFGFILPGLLAAALVGGLLYIKSELRTSMANKRTLYAKDELNLKEINKLETRLVRQRPLAKLWKGLLEDETAKTLAAEVSDLRGKLPEAEFQQTSFNPSRNRGTFSTSPAFPSIELQISFRASYRAMQQGFLEIESRLPQLQLQELKIERAPGEPTLNFQATYTAWTK
jgi:hypothetical protein